MRVGHVSSSVFYVSCLTCVVLPVLFCRSLVSSYLASCPGVFSCLCDCVISFTWLVLSRWLPCVVIQSLCFCPSCLPTPAVSLSYDQSSVCVYIQLYTPPPSVSLWSLSVRLIVGFRVFALVWSFSCTCLSWFSCKNFSLK